MSPPPVLEVCQFSRDASVAEAWLIAQEPYVASREVGHSVNEVEKLLKRHEAFEKSTASWEERFCALERLTTVRPAPNAAAAVAMETRTSTQTVAVLGSGRVGAWELRTALALWRVGPRKKNDLVHE